MHTRRTPPDIELTREDTIWVARHVETGIASHGDTPNEAVSMVKDAVHLHQQTHDPAPEAYQREMLRKLDIELTRKEVSEETDTPDGMP